jgi:hypothetical protein
MSTAPSVRALSATSGLFNLPCPKIGISPIISLTFLWIGFGININEIVAVI